MQTSDKNSKEIIKNIEINDNSNNQTVKTNNENTTVQSSNPFKRIFTNLINMFGVSAIKTKKVDSDANNKNEVNNTNNNSDNKSDNNVNETSQDKTTTPTKEKFEIEFKEIKNAKYKNGGKFKATPKWIVVHYTAVIGAGAKSCATSYTKTTRAVSTHFFCDSKEIYRCVDEKHIAWHVGNGTVQQPLKDKTLSLEELVAYGDKPNWKFKLAAENHIKWQKSGDDCKGNSMAFGVDLCTLKKSTKTKSVTDDDWYCAEEAFKNAEKCVAYLCYKYGIGLDHVVRHADLTGKPCLPIDKTEIFTPRGFVCLSEIKKDDIVFQYNKDYNCLEETKVLSVVEPYKTIICKTRGYEATLNHRTLAKTKRGYTITEPLEKLLGRDLIIFTSCENKNKGLPLTDDEIRFLVQVQGDGHFSYEWNKARTIKSFRTICFHVKKERKIFNIISLLDRLGWRYYVNRKKNGSVNICVPEKEKKEFVEKWLDKKCFTSKLYAMSHQQFLVFLDELWKVDSGSTSNKLLYCTKQKENLDVVQGLCAINKIRTHFYMLKNGCYMLSIVRSNYNFAKNAEFYEGDVSCIEVQSGYIMIRQNGTTFLTGNCPRPLVSLSGDKDQTVNDKRWIEFKENVKSILENYDFD